MPIINCYLREMSSRRNRDLKCLSLPQLWEIKRLEMNFHEEKNVVFPSPLQRTEITVRENVPVAKEMTGLLINDDCLKFP